MKKIVLAFLIMSAFLMGCKDKNEYESSIYEGENLTIAVIGEKPEVREKNIQFRSITLEELESNMTGIDAIFITKERLEQAAKPEYVKLYHQMKMPVFFIESEKSYIPFIYEDIAYEDAPNINDQMYVAGMMSDGTDEVQVWGFGLYNDVVNETNIKSAYSDIFETIASLGKE